jgi:hypothetical protein
MYDVSAAAEFLADTQSRLEPPVRRVVEAGVVVVYARPFTDGKVGRLGANYAPKDTYFKALHKRLLELRNRLQAHTDVTTVRYIAENIDMREVDAAADERVMAAEVRVQTLTPLEIRALSGLGNTQGVRFATEAHSLRKELRLNSFSWRSPIEFENEESLRRALGRFGPP